MLKPGDIYKFRNKIVVILSQCKEPAYWLVVVIKDFNSSEFKWSVGQVIHVTEEEIQKEGKKLKLVEE